MEDREKLAQNISENYRDREAVLTPEQKISAEKTFIEVYELFIKKVVSVHVSQIDTHERHIRCWEEVRDRARKSREDLEINGDFHHLNPQSDFDYDEELQKNILIVSVQMDSYIVYIFSVFDCFVANIAKILMLLSPNSIKSDAKEGVSVGLAQVLDHPDMDSLVNYLVSSAVRSLNNKPLVDRIQYIDQKFFGGKKDAFLIPDECKSVIRSASLIRNLVVHDMLEVSLGMESGLVKIKPTPSSMLPSKSPSDLYGNFVHLSSAFMVVSSRIIRSVFEKVIQKPLPSELAKSCTEMEREGLNNLKNLAKK